MKKYIVNTCWEGSYAVTIEAENETEAREKALNVIAGIPDKEFYPALDVQLCDTDIQKISDENWI